MANFQGNRINPSRFSQGQLKFHAIAFPLSIFMIIPVIYLINQAFKPLGELFRFPPTIFVQNPTMGNIEFSLQEDQDSFNYDIECDMGSVEIGGSGFSGMGREQRVNNHASKEFEVSCNLGNINISFQEQ